MTIFYKPIFFLIAALMILPLITEGKVYSDNDLKRILLLKKQPYDAPVRYVVLEKIRDNSLECKYLGTQQKLKLPPKDVVPMLFYEDSSNFEITQYALWAILTRKKPNYALELAKINNDNTGRITVLNAFLTTVNALRKNVQQLRKDFHNNPAELSNGLSDLLSNDKLLPQVQQAATTNDWLLTVTLFELYKQYVLKQYEQLFTNPTDVIKDAQAKYSNCANDLLLNFTAKMQQPNVRRQLFLQHFPNARGIWSQPPPTSYEQLKNILLRCMKSYHRLDNISKLLTPQDWGTAMLDVLLVVEGTPCAAELEKEFDDEIRRLAKYHQRH